MPQPRNPTSGPDPLAAVAEDLEPDIALALEESKAWASTAVHYWMPVVEAILAESEQLRMLNPSASVVWSVQALEVFLKKAVLGPALRVRLGYDPELSEVISSLSL
jgi:hypothetical protein